MASGPGLVELFEADHRDCDRRWTAVEVAAGDAAAVPGAWRAFDDAVRTHLRMEEEVLFPALEAAMGGHLGPTTVMRMEHDQMRALLDRMASALAKGDVNGLLDQGDTLNLLVQQHNTKEEAMIYPTAEQALAREWSELERRLSRYPRSAV